MDLHVLLSVLGQLLRNRGTLLFSFLTPLIPYWANKFPCSDWTAKKTQAWFLAKNNKRNLHASGLYASDPFEGGFFRFKNPDLEFPKESLPQYTTMKLYNELLRLGKFLESFS